MKYEFLEHTADAKFRAYGANLEEAVVNAALATFSIIISPEKIEPLIKKEIKIISRKKTSLLYDFLDELLFFLDTEGFVLSNIKNLKIENDENFVLTCIIYGDSYKNYASIKGNIKSVTYNEMIIDEEYSGDKVMIQVVVDV
jgi:SHS2 domain-containing protein